MKERPLIIWTITRRPRDLPGVEYALRGHEVGVGTASALAEVQTAETLEEIRAMLPPGLACLGRAEADDPCIVESWI